MTLNENLIMMFLLMLYFLFGIEPNPYSSIGSLPDLRGFGSLWFHPRLGQYSFQGLMLVIVTGFDVLTMVRWDNSHWLGQNTVQSTGKKEIYEKMEKWTGCCSITEIMLKCH